MCSATPSESIVARAACNATLDNAFSIDPTIYSEKTDDENDDDQDEEEDKEDDTSNKNDNDDEFCKSLLYDNDDDGDESIGDDTKYYVPWAKRTSTGRKQKHGWPEKPNTDSMSKK